MLAHSKLSGCARLPSHRAQQLSCGHLAAAQRPALRRMDNRSRVSNIARLGSLVNNGRSLYPRKPTLPPGSSCDRCCCRLWCCQPRCCVPLLLLSLQCLAMSTAQKVSELPASLQKIVGAFQMVSAKGGMVHLRWQLCFFIQHACRHAALRSRARQQQYAAKHSFQVNHR